MSSKLIKIIDSDNNIVYPNIIQRPFRTNPNLLDNWYFVGGGAQNRWGVFPINQRGKTSYTTSYSYTIDRWKMANPGYVTLNSDSIKMSIETTSNARIISQPLPAKDFQGKKVTISLLIKTNTTTNGLAIALFNGNTSTSFTRQIGTHVWTKGTGLITTTIPIPSTLSYTYLCFVIWFVNGSGNTGYVELIAAKMEFGEEQTLAHLENGKWILNEIPNFNNELVKCQSYLLKIDPWKRYRMSNYTADLMDFTIPIPTTMRYGQGATIIGTPIVETITGTKQTGFTFARIGDGAGHIEVRATKTSHGLTDGLIFGESTWWISKEP